MKNLRIACIFLFAFLFSSCFSVPGYVARDGSVTPPYAKEIKIEAVKGAVTVSMMETSKGIENINPVKSDAVKSEKKDSVYLAENNCYSYMLEGNHSMVLGIRTVDDEAVFKITYKNVMTKYTVYSSDLSDKIVYIENH